MHKSKILGTGTFFPKKILTNDDLSKMVDTNDEWIYERTGIKQRHISSTEGGEFPSDMAYHATKVALKEANLEPDDIDFILLSTATPEYKLPSTSTVLQTKLGITTKCGSLDIAAACSGWIYGLNMAQAMIAVGMYKNILVVGSEMLSTAVDWEDRTTCILLGDGAGAAIVGRTPEGEDSEILGTFLAADGTGKEFFEQTVGGAAIPITPEHIEKRQQFMTMKGREMFKVATRTLADNSKKVIEQAGMTLNDIDWIIPHQANQRIIETTAKLLDLSMDKIIMNIRDYANTSTATIPTAFHQAVQEGKIKRGDIILLTTFGAGLTSGATLLRY